MFAIKTRILPTLLLSGACLAFTGFALGIPATAATTSAALSCNGLAITDVVPPGGALFVPAVPAANNVILGTSGADWIQSGAGNDTICSLSGADRVYGENGNDKILSGDGNDWLWGGNGDDRFFCGAGWDHVNGGPHTWFDAADAFCEVVINVP